MDDTTKQYIAATSKAAGRSRVVLWLITTASVIVFTYVLNSRKEGWVKQRPVVTANAEIIMATNWILSPGYSSAVSNLTNVANTNASASNDFNAARARFFDERMLQLSKGMSNESYVAAKKYLDKTDIRRLEEIRAQNDSIQRKFTDLFTLHIPFFGVSIDSNDIGMLGGFTFVVLMLILKMCMSREYSNLLLTRAKAKAVAVGNKDADREIYELLTMEQVMALPKLNECTDHGLLRYAWNVLFLLPLMVHGMIVARDLNTFDIGSNISHAATLTLITTEFLWLGFLLPLTWNCLRLSYRTEEIWDEWWTELQKPKP